MNSILLKYNKSRKKISISKSYSALDLGHLIAHTFDIKQKIIGASDTMGRFYDLENIAQNLQKFKNQMLTLVTYKELNQDNMSFASSNLQTITPQKIQKSEKQQSDFGFQQTQKSSNVEPIGVLGYIQDIPTFEKLFLQSSKFTIIVKSPAQKRLPKLKFPYYIASSTQIIIVIYYGEKKICELYNESWQNIEQKVQSIIKNDEQKRNGFNKKKWNVQQKKKQQPLRDYSFQPFSKQMILENLKILLQNQDINQNQYLKLKCELLENPQQFYQKYHLNEQSSMEGFRSQILKSKQQKQQKTGYQDMLNNFRGYSKDRSRDNRNKKYQIPIIIRKNNNVIQKISTNYLISYQQEHSIHLIAELQLKGLISQTQANFIKSLILYQNQEAFGLFMEYFNNHIDQIQLSKKLKQLKKYHVKKPQSQSMNQRQSLMKLILKYASPFNLQILKRLILENNEHIVNAYDQYGYNRNEQLFGENLQKIANFYKAKEELQSIKQQITKKKEKHRSDKYSRQIQF